MSTSYGIRGFSRVFAAILLLVAAGPVVAASGGAPSTGTVRLEDLFAEGNALYEAGDFEGAIDRYSALLDAGAADTDIYYNLANSYYKVDDLGRAVLFYERARRAAPRDRDVRENLALVRTQLRDKQFVREQNRVIGAVVWLHNNLNAREMVLLASLSYLLLCILGIVFVFRESVWVSGVYRRVSLVSPGRLAGLAKSQDLLAVIVIVSVLFITTGISAFGKVARESERRTAVVLEKEVPVFSGPTEDTTLQFKVHEGTVLRIREERRGWIRIGLPGGLSGWVSGSSVERV